MTSASWNARRTIRANLIAAMFLSPIAPAAAQETGGDEAVPVVDPAMASRNHVIIGVGAALLPDFQGARRYELQPVPIVDVVKGRFFAKAGEGIGVRAVDKPKLQAGVSVNWTRGYQADEVPAGIGKLGDTFGGRAFVSGQVAGFAAIASVTAPVFGGDAEGVLADLRVSRPIRVSDRIMVSPAVGMSWASGQYMRRTFGVDEQQAARSSLPTYRPSGGIKDVDARLAVNFRLNDRINLIGIGLLTRNFDRITDSPFVSRRWSPAGVVGLGYAF